MIIFYFLFPRAKSLHQYILVDELGNENTYTNTPRVTSINQFTMRSNVMLFMPNYIILGYLYEKYESVKS